MGASFAALYYSGFDLLSEVTITMGFPRLMAWKSTAGSLAERVPLRY